MEVSFVRLFFYIDVKMLMAYDPDDIMLGFVESLVDFP